MTGKVGYRVKGQILTVKTEGIYEVGEFIDTIRAAFNSHLNSSTVAMIIDVRDSNNIRTEEDYQKIMDCLVVQADRIACLACVTLSDKIFEIIQKAASYAEYNDWGYVKPFKDIDSAQNWIERFLKKN